LYRLHFPGQAGEENKLLDPEDEGDKIQETSVNMSPLTRWKIRRGLNGVNLDEL
jgi:hypothetical protein